MNGEPTPIDRWTAGAEGSGPVVLGLAGDSASGKSTLARGIEYVLGPPRVGRVCTDDYHRHDRGERAALGITPLAPGANRLELMAGHLHDLAVGRSVVKPTYDHGTGTFGPEERVEPGEFVIVEGLLALADRRAREAIDVGVYLEPEERLRRRWKLERDVFERGYSPREVVAELGRREPDAAEFVRPQREHAAIVVRFHPARGAGDDGDLSARLTVRPTIPFPRLRDVVGSIGRRGLEAIRWSTATDRRGPVSVLDIDGDCPPEVGGAIEDVLWSYLRPDDRIQGERLGIVRRPGQGERRSEALALSQLLIVAYLVGAFDGSFDL